MGRCLLSFSFLPLDPTKLKFASTIAGFVIPFSGLSSDYSTYYRPNVSAYVRLSRSHARIAYHIISQMENILVLVHCLAGPTRTPLPYHTVEGNAERLM